MILKGILLTLVVLALIIGILVSIGKANETDTATGVLACNLTLLIYIAALYYIAMSIGG